MEEEFSYEYLKKLEDELIKQVYGDVIPCGKKVFPRFIPYLNGLGMENTKTIFSNRNVFKKNDSLILLDIKREKIHTKNLEKLIPELPILITQITKSRPRDS